jgi:hypothetical protein
MKPTNRNPNTKLLKVLEGLVTAVGEALIEQKISATPALKKAHKKAFAALRKTLHNGQ